MIKESICQAGEKIALYMFQRESEWGWWANPEINNCRKLSPLLGLVGGSGGRGVIRVQEYIWLHRLHPQYWNHEESLIAETTSQGRVAATSRDNTRGRGRARKKCCFFPIPVSDSSNTSYCLNLPGSLLAKETPSPGITEQSYEGQVWD